LSGSVASVASTTSGGILTFALGQAALHGAVVVNTDGSYIYTPDANFNGSDSFTYSVNDSLAGESLVQTVNLTVAAVNDAPTSDASVSVVTQEDAAVSGTVSAKDVDIATNGDALSYTSTHGTHGQVSIGALTGNWTYNPDANFNGADSFTVTVTDIAGLSTQQVVNLSVSSVADLVANQGQKTPCFLDR
jgi:VCBS repeat-containing protein